MSSGFIKAQKNLIPLPVYIEEKNGHFDLNNNTKYFIEKGLEHELKFIIETLQRATGLSLSKSKKPTKNCIIFSSKTTRTELGDEGYELEISNQNIIIRANTSKGMFYAVQTLLQLMPGEVYSSSLDVKKEACLLSAVYIFDYPRFTWRGMMLDVSRQFFPADYIKRYIDWLSMHKINVFHWHLTDDEGWRIEIKKYPLLTEKGAWRGKNEVLPPAYGSGEARYGGYYSHDEIIDIVNYANDRHVSILPEIDMPGHSRAVTVTYPETLCLTNDTTASVQGIRKNVWCAGREENFQIIEGILSEVSALFPFEYIHIGGDEVNKKAWENCERCRHLMEQNHMTDMHEVQSYFIRRVEAIVNKLGKKMIGWNEIMEGGQLNKNTSIMAWLSEAHGYKAAQQNYNVIMVPGSYLYFDMAQSGDEQGHSWAGMVPVERVYSFDPMANDTLTSGELQHIKGVQAALWSEFLDKPAGIADYQTYPRLCALSELAWTPQNQREWSNFENRLQSAHYNRLYNMGISFRLPPPEAVYKDGIISVMAPGINLVTRYTTDGSEPDANAPVYTNPIETTLVADYKFRTFFKNHGSISTPALINAAATWTPENTPAVFTGLNFDVTPFIRKNGQVNVKFRLKGGKHGLQVKKVILLQDGKEIGTDQHDGVIAAGRTTNNIYRFRTENHSDASRYHIIVEIQGRWGTDSYGDILVYTED